MTLVAAWVVGIALRLPSPHWLLLNLVIRWESALGASAPVGLTVLFSPISVALIAAIFVMGMRRTLGTVAIHALLSASLLVFVNTALVVRHIDEPAVLQTLLIYQTLVWFVVSAGILWSDRAPRNMHNRATDVCLALAASLGILGFMMEIDHARALRIPEHAHATFLWPRPETEKAGDYADASAGHGLQSIALFGEWPKVLERAGWIVRRAEAFDESVLKESDLLVVASPPKVWREGEVARVTQWVRSGKSLLVVGEHTDLDGSQRLLNPLVEPFGLHLNFDTTNGLLGDGLHGVLTALHPIGRALAASPRLPYNRGGSIGFAANGQPILLGRYWHADAGDTLAEDHAFLSDYRLSANDQLGDVVLMAMSKAGLGRVVLVGDSTPFLNQNTLYASGFLLDLAAYLVGSKSGGMTFWIVTGFTSILVGVLVIRMPRRSLAGSLVCVVLAGYPMTSITLMSRHERHRWDSTPRFAIVSTAENNLVDNDPFAPKSPTALGLALSRRNLTPWLGDWTPLENRPRVLAILNPTRSPSARQLAKLKKWMEDGTTVLMAGNGNNAVFHDIARGFGVAITETPVGSVRADRFTTFSAWEVASCPDGASTMRATAHTIGCIGTVGVGKLVIVADGGFFLSQNLEGERSIDERNIAWVDGLLRNPSEP